MTFYRAIMAAVWVAVSTATAGTLVQFRTALGDVEVELLNAEKPVTVSNFLAYVRSGAYSNSFFHRSVPDFVLQGGGYAVTNLGKTNVSVAPIPTLPPITNEFHVGPFESNVAGTIAMAKTSDPNSATSEFFFNLVNNASSLDDTNNSGGFTVFGKVVGGTNAFALFNSFTGNFAPPYTNLVVNLGSPFDELPILGLSTNGSGPYVNFTNLVFVAVHTIDLSIQAGPAGRTIRWNSATQGTNVLEYSTTLPPVWQTLTNVVRPAAGYSSVLDTSPDRARLYRVRVAY